MPVQDNQTTFPAFAICCTDTHHVHKTKPRAKLTITDAINIFLLKTGQSTATNISRQFGVNEKTVRDIWTGRTWVRETNNLGASRPLVLKSNGRPKSRCDELLRNKRSRMQDSVPYKSALPESIHSTPSDDIQVFHKKFPETVQLSVSQSGGHQHSASPRSSTPTIDEQLYVWDTYGSSIQLEDPFRRDWPFIADHDHCV